MPAAVLAPITPAVLDWAIGEAGFTPETLAQRLKVEPVVVRTWLAGTAQPGSTEFGSLAKALGRPRSFFFLPSPPPRHQVPVTFRSAPGSSMRDLIPAEAAAVRQARRLQRITRWARQATGEAAPVLPAILGDVQPEAAAERLRAFLGWSLLRQTEAASPTAVTKDLRQTLEEHGVIAMQQALGEKGCRGFSLSDPLTPALAVNSAYTTEARTYSYVHELGHLVRRDDAICTGSSDQGLERWCEEFAAAFLLPRHELLAFANEVVGRGKPVTTPSQVTRIANRFRVSRLATVTGLQQYGRASQLLWNEIKQQSDIKRKQGGGPTGEPQTSPVIRLREWGRTPTRLLLDAADQGALSRPDLLEHLDLSSAQVDDVRRMLSTPSDAED
jgi:Zn-dependent peptidase ImmA (M78 family)